jgi:MarR family transcriptional regulator for hemolysin
LISLEERFSSALHTTARTWKAAINRRLKFLGLSQAGWTTIAAIAKSERARSQIELANQLGVEAATMVAMIDRLAKAQLITREPSPHDRRIKLIVLTEAGAQLYSKVRAEADKFRHEILADIDPAKLVMATELLEHLQRVTEASI